MEQTKELQELLDGIMALAVKLAKHLKDGFQWHDIPALMKEYQEDKEFSDYLNKAFEGASKVPGEMKALGPTEGLQVAMGLIPWAQKLIKELHQ